MLLTEKQQKLQIKIRKLRSTLSYAESQLRILTAACEHPVTVEAGYESVRCCICDQDLGWWCPDSPNHVCDYSDEYGWDECAFCGNPEERK